MKIKLFILSIYPVAPFSDKLNLVPTRYEHSASWIRNLLSEFSTNPDLDVSLATFSELIDQSYTLKANNVTYYFLKTERNRYRRLSLFALDIIRLRKLVHQLEPDLIHAHGTEDCYGFVTMITKRPVIFSIHGAMRECAKFDRSVSRRISAKLESFVLRRVKYLIEQTPYIEQAYADILRKTQIFCLDLPVDRIFFEVTGRQIDNVITFVGNGSYMKGCDILLRIASKLVTRFNDLHVRIIGNFRSEVLSFHKRLAESEGISQHVRFLGVLGAPEIARHLAETKVFVLPTRADTYGVSMAEALAAAVPVVSSNTMGVPYVIEDGVDGFLLGVDDIDGFVERVSILLENEDLRQTMGRQGREIANRRWRPEIVAEKMLMVYRQILGQS